MKRILLTAGTLLLLVFLLLHPQEGLAAARTGMTLWLNSLIPALLPFIILTGVLIHTGSIEKILLPFRPLFEFLLGVSVYGGYVFLLGMLCGYPMGAKLASDMYESHKISRREAEYLTTFCNNASPSFIITYLGQICLLNKVPASRLFLCLFLSDFICMMIFRLLIYRNHLPGSVPHTDRHDEKKETSSAPLSGNALDVSIMNGFETITRLGGYILLFSILAGCISLYWPFSPVSRYVLLGFTDITTGLSLIADSGLPFRFCCILSAAAVGSGGACILAQTRSILHKDLRLLPCLTSKCLNAVLTGMIACLLLR